MKRDQFTFYRSYYEAIKTLPAKELKSVLLAICSYALDEEAPALSGIANSVFVLIRPTLDSGRKKAENRVNKRGTKREQNENKTEQNRNESEGEREIESEIESEREGEGEVEREDDMSISIIPVIPSAREAPPASPPSKTSASVGYFLRHINASASGECLRELLDYEHKLGSDVCIYAMRYAIDEQKTAWSYIRAILAAYARDGVKSVDDIKRRDMQRGQRPTGKNAARNAQYSTHGGSVSDLERKAIEAALREGGA